MNKIYKIIWSKTRNCYVVASELAKRNAKGSGVRSCRMKAACVLSSLLTCAFLVGGYGVSTAWGAPDPGDNAKYVYGTDVIADPEHNATAWGYYTRATGTGATAWGYGVAGSGTPGEPGYEEAKYVEALGFGATAWGYVTKAVGD